MFSLTGQHRRIIQGAFWRPQRICFLNDRLYIIEGEFDDEEADEEDDEVTAAAKRMASRRVNVLTPEGATLQVWEAKAKLSTMCPFDGKLFVATAPNDQPSETYEKRPLIFLDGV